MQVSVVIPCYNSGEWLESTVLSAANQTLPPLEILCIDDASDNDTADRLDRLKQRVGETLKVLRQPERGGIGAARNRGSAEASGDWIALLDHDDLWLPEKLEKQAELLAQTPNAALLHARCWEETAGSASSRSLMHAWKWPSGASPFPYLFLSNFIVPCTVLIRRSVLEQAGGFEVRPDRHGKDDIELWLRLAGKHLPFAFVDEPLAVRRVHDRNYSSNAEEFLRGRYDVLLEAFERDRTGSRELLISEAMVRLLGVLFERIDGEFEGGEFGGDDRMAETPASKALTHVLEASGGWLREALLAERMALRFPGLMGGVSQRAKKNRHRRAHHMIETASAGGRALAQARRLAAAMRQDPVAVEKIRELSAQAADEANRAARKAYRRRAEYEQNYGGALITRS